MPIVPLQAPVACLLCDRSAIAESPDDASTDFDFRSPQFDVDALTLARVTGHVLVSCRQELFMAEGDMSLAFELLISGYGIAPSQPASH